MSIFSSICIYIYIHIQISTYIYIIIRVYLDDTAMISIWISYRYDIDIIWGSLVCKLPSSWPRQARKGSPFFAARVGWATRRSRRSNVTFFEILCGTPVAAGVLLVFPEKRHSHCSPARSGEPSPPPFRPGRQIFMIFLDSVLGGSSLALPGLDFLVQVGF